MNCEKIRNQLLAEPNPNRVPVELRPHVAGCKACREFLVRYELLVSGIQSLPVPSGELAKIAFVDSLGHAGPIIRSIPGQPASTFSWKHLMQRAAKPLMGTAAAVSVGLGIWAVNGTRRPPAEVVAPRHELLKKVVAANASLARTSIPKERIATLSDLAADLGSETHDVIKAADEEDLTSLAVQYEKVVNDGLVNQAKLLNLMTMSSTERHAIIDAAAARLSLTADDASALALNAPPHAKASLTRIEAAARGSREKLIRIANGGGA